MELNERILYHKIHPLKIAIDATSAAAAMVMLWEKHWIIAFFMLFMPAQIASQLLVMSGNLEPLKKSQLGAYVAQYLTRSVEMAQAAGVGVMGLGAWFQMPWVMAAGLLIVAGAWLSGVFFPNPES